MIKISAIITKAIKERELWWEENDLIGKLYFDEEDE
jgi:hypothetical protein